MRTPRGNLSKWSRSPSDQRRVVPWPRKLEPSPTWSAPPEPKTACERCSKQRREPHYKYERENEKVAQCFNWQFIYPRTRIKKVYSAFFSSIPDTVNAFSFVCGMYTCTPRGLFLKHNEWEQHCSSSCSSEWIQQLCLVKSVVTWVTCSIYLCSYVAFNVKLVENRMANYDFMNHLQLDFC